MLSLLLAIFSSGAWAGQASGVILVVADGMGISALGLARDYNEKVLKRPPLALERFLGEARTGLVLTSSESHWVTDSAAAATAMACGVRTRNGFLGMDAAGRPCTSVLEMFQAQGYPVGLVTTDEVVGATPAAFVAHDADRGHKRTIAQEVLDKKARVVFGGGRRYFDLARARESGFILLQKPADLEAVMSGRKSPEGPVLGLFSEEEMSLKNSLLKIEPGLPEMARKALELLERGRRKGSPFFLLVETERTDIHAHRNQVQPLVDSILELDRTLSLLQDYVHSRSRTLLIFVSDHDTGGLSVGRRFGFLGRPGWGEVRKFGGVGWRGYDHTATPVILAAWGPGMGRIRGIQDHTAVFHLIKSILF